MDNKPTIQIRIDRQLHKQLKYHSFEVEKTITKLATQMILYCLANKIDFEDEIDTIQTKEDSEK